MAKVNHVFFARFSYSEYVQLLTAMGPHPSSYVIIVVQSGPKSY